jgi:hypothetical protein
MLHALRRVLIGRGPSGAVPPRTPFLMDALTHLVYKRPYKNHLKPFKNEGEINVNNLIRRPQTPYYTKAQTIITLTKKNQA